jgi:hypothetical protein
MSKEIIWEGMLHGQPTSMLVESDHTVTIEPITEGVLSNVAKGIWGFAQAHPVITAAAGLYAWDALKKYNEAKSKALSFYAKDSAEKNRMSQVIAQMTKNGYKIVNQKYKGATGYEWNLEKTK